MSINLNITDAIAQFQKDPDDDTFFFSISSISFLWQIEATDSNSGEGEISVEGFFRFQSFELQAL